jgi:hypothetical protein
MAHLVAAHFEHLVLRDAGRRCRTASVAAVVLHRKPVDAGAAEPIGEMQDRLDKSVCDVPAPPQLATEHRRFGSSTSSSAVSVAAPHVNVSSPGIRPLS